MDSDKRFYVEAIWDDEAGVYYSKSNITGLHLEAPTLQEFEVLIKEHASELIRANYPQSLSGNPQGQIKPRTARYDLSEIAA